MKSKIFSAILLPLAIFFITSLSANAQKTASAIVRDVLTMNGVSGIVLGYRVTAVVSEPYGLDPGRYNTFDFAPTNVKTTKKTEGLINYTTTSATINYPFISPIASETSTNMDVSNISNITLTLTQSTLAAMATELGSFSYTYTNSYGSFQITYSLNTSMLVLNPSSTTVGGIFFGKVPIKVKNLTTNSTSNAGYGVIHLNVRHNELEG
jgi:hypothetical protein